MARDRRAEFRRFAQLREAQASPLYSHLAAHIAEDPSSYNNLFAAIPTHEQAPNLLFAAVHLLLSTEPETPLARYYASIHQPALPPDDPAQELFREFCVRHRESILSLISGRRTQTNEVRRGLALWPAGSLAFTLSGEIPLVLVEIGCSAGLNLFWDRYGYLYRNGAGEEFRAGPLNSTLQMDARLIGSLKPPITPRPPTIHQRVGIDLHPLDIHSTDDIEWLQALIWPEHHDRRDFLRDAIATAKETSLDLRSGDALELLPEIAGELPTGCAPLFFHTYVTQQLSQPDRVRLPRLIAQVARRFHHAFHLWHERGEHSSYPELVLRHFMNGETASTRLLAYAGAHVRWLEWRDAASARR